MIERFTIGEMVARWKLRMGLEPLRTDGVALRIDGFDIDALLEQYIYDWYTELLQTAPVHLLDITEQADRCVIEDVTDGVVRVKLPTGCRRVAEVRLRGWKRGVVPTDSPSEALQNLLSNKYSLPGAESPVAILRNDILLLYSLPTSQTDGEVESLRCVMEPADGSIILDTSLLSTIPAALPLNS